MDPTTITPFVPRRGSTRCHGLHQRRRPPPPDSLDGVFARAALLDQLGLADEATLERDHLASQPHDPAARVRVAQAFLAHGFATIATRLAGTALAHGWPRDAAVWRLLYPLPFARTLELATTKEALDPYLVAALIRQESGWNPEATSRTGARGLMQIQPSTGRQLAKTLGFSDFDPALLWVPQVNMAFGAHHLATAMDRYPDLMRSVAAYNAGARRVNAWSAAPFSGEALSRNEIRDPLADVDLFVERIPYTETRNYVRAIIRNEAVYRMLYPALAQAGAGGVSAASRDQRR